MYRHQRELVTCAANLMLPKKPLLVQFPCRVQNTADPSNAGPCGWRISAPDTDFASLTLLCHEILRGDAELRNPLRLLRICNDEKLSKAERARYPIIVFFSHRPL